MRSPSWLLLGGRVFEQFRLVVAISESFGGYLISYRLAAIGHFFGVILYIGCVLREIYPGHLVDSTTRDLRKGLGGLDVWFSF